MRDRGQQERMTNSMLGACSCVTKGVCMVEDEAHETPIHSLTPLYLPMTCA